MVVDWTWRMRRREEKRNPWLADGRVKSPLAEMKEMLGSGWRRESEA